MRAGSTAATVSRVAASTQNYQVLPLVKTLGEGRRLSGHNQGIRTLPHRFSVAVRERCTRIRVSDESRRAIRTGRLRLQKCAGAGQADLIVIMR